MKASSVLVQEGLYAALRVAKVAGSLCGSGIFYPFHANFCVSSFLNQFS